MCFVAVCIVLFGAIILSDKEKVNFTQEQAIKAVMGSRGIAVFFL
jgi:hypothetical protein